jgi:hypothetical protein
MLRVSHLLSFCFLLLLHSSAFSQTSCAPSTANSTSSGFRLASLPRKLQAEARTTLQDLLDHEGLYTVFSDLKPMSTGFWSTRYPEAEGEPVAVQNMRQILATFRIEQHITAGVLVFDKSYEGTRFAEGFVANLPVLKRLLQQHAEFFQSLGLNPHSSAQEIIETVDRAEPAKRFRGFGLLFGYPQHAVDFFVTAQQQQQETEKFVERDFFHVETFSQEKGAFVWAVPKGHIPNDDDLKIQTQAKVVLDRYRQLRNIWSENALPLETLVNYWLQPSPTIEQVAYRDRSDYRRSVRPFAKWRTALSAKLRRDCR